MERYEGQLIRKFDSEQNGNAAAGVGVEVFHEDGTTPATVYTVNAQTSEKSQPFNTNVDGRFWFYAPNGTYWLKFDSGDDPIQIYLFDPADFNIFDEIYVVDSEAEMLALTPTKTGAFAIRTDQSNMLYMLSAFPASDANNWVPMNISAGVVSWNGESGVVTADYGNLPGLQDAVFQNALGARGTTTAAATVNIGAVNANDEVVLGDTQIPTTLHSSVPLVWDNGSSLRTMIAGASNIGNSQDGVAVYDSTVGANLRFRRMIGNGNINVESDGNGNVVITQAGEVGVRTLNGLGGDLNLVGDGGVTVTPDGPNGEIVIEGAGAGGGTRSGFWLYDSATTIADPGVGNLISDAAPGSSTSIAVSTTTTTPVDASDILSTIQEHDVLYLQESGSSDNWARYRVTGDAIDNTSWFEIPVVFEDGEGAVSKGVELLVRFAYSTGITAVEWQSDGTSVLSSGIANFSPNFSVSDVGGVATVDLSDDIDVKSNNDYMRQSLNSGVDAYFSGGSWVNSYNSGFRSFTDMSEFDGVVKILGSGTDISRAENFFSYGLFYPNIGAIGGIDSRVNTMQYGNSTGHVFDMSGNFVDQDDRLTVSLANINDSVVSFYSFDKSDQLKIGSFSSIGEEGFVIEYDDNSGKYFAYTGQNSESSNSIDVFESIDCINWTLSHSESLMGDGDFFCVGLVFSGSTIVLIALDFDQVNNTTLCRSIYSSDSGSNWNSTTIGSDLEAYSIVSGGNFVLIASDFSSGGVSRLAIYSSSDGAVWTETTPFSQDILASGVAVAGPNEYAVLYGNSTTGSESYPDIYVVTSSDGSTWSSPSFVADVNNESLRLNVFSRHHTTYGNGTMFASLDSSNTLGGKGFETWALTSNDAGSTWSLNKILNGNYYNFYYIDGSIYCSANDVYARSDDDGATFNVISNSRRFYSFVPGSSVDQPYATNARGIYKLNAYNESFFGGPKKERPVLTSGTHKELRSALGTTSGIGLVDDSSAPEDLTPVLIARYRAHSNASQTITGSDVSVVFGNEIEDTASISDNGVDFIAPAGATSFEIDWQVAWGNASTGGKRLSYIRVDDSAAQFDPFDTRDEVSTGVTINQVSSPKISVSPGQVINVRASETDGSGADIITTTTGVGTWVEIEFYA